MRAFAEIRLISKVLFGFAIIWFMLETILFFAVPDFMDPFWSQIASVLANLSWIIALSIEINDEAKRREKEQPRPLDETVDFHY